MKIELRIVLLMLLSMVSTSIALAHHSHANLDRNDVRRLTGVVSEYGWAMPHVYIKAMAPNQSGDIVEYSIELLHPPAMAERGWAADTFAPGDRITWEGAWDRNPNRYYTSLSWAEKADGTRLTSDRAEAEITPSTDLTGLWRRDPRVGFTYYPPADWPYSERGQALVDAFNENQNPQIDCQNPGPPKSTLLPYPIKISRSSDAVHIDYELRDQPRVIHLNADVPAGEPSKIGHSIGHFEGDELVVETSNFIADRWGSHTGVDSSEQKHLIERFSLIEGGMVMKVVMTLTDPVYLSEPVEIDYYLRKVADRELVDAVCTSESARFFLEAGL